MKQPKLTELVGLDSRSGPRRGARVLLVVHGGVINIKQVASRWALRLRVFERRTVLSLAKHCSTSYWSPLGEGRVQVKWLRHEQHAMMAIVWL